MDHSGQHQEREVVYCHQCENEWYRDEHGIACPECHSDFTEIVEPQNDPRHDEQHIPADVVPNQPLHGQGDFNAPDPDEDDIDNLRLEETGPGRYRLRGTYRGTYPLGGQQQQQAGQGAGAGAGGLMGIVNNVLQGYLRGQQQQQGGQQAQQQRDPVQQQVGLYAPGRPASAPVSPAQGGQQGGGNGTFVRHHHGPGYSVTIASSSNANFGPGLLPRNANAPQPFQNQPDHIEQMLNHMMMNIGAVPRGPFRDGMRAAPGQQPRIYDDMHPGFGDNRGGGPFAMGGGDPGQFGNLGPFANLFNLFGPPGGIAGDAVFSQEALDRVITQLMEQHQTGNAPGPASEAAINSLPKKQISEKDQGDSGKAECSICMDEVELGGTVSLLPCSHWFHHDCIKAWLTEHDTCPHCRQGIMPKNGDGDTAQPRSPSQAPLHDMRSAQYTRPSVPGAFPFPGQNVGGVRGDGSQQNPLQVPDSPTMNRTRSRSAGTPGGQSSGGGVFSRMRDAFGRGSSGTGEGGNDPGSRG